MYRKHLVEEQKKDPRVNAILDTGDEADWRQKTRRMKKEQAELKRRRIAEEKELLRRRQEKREREEHDND